MQSSQLAPEQAPTMGGTPAVHATAGANVDARPVPLPAAAALAAISGGLYVLAFPGMGVWPLAFVALVPLLIALRGRGVGAAAFLGWTAGMATTLFGFRWMFQTLRTFTGASATTCAALFVALCAWQAGRMALSCGLYARAKARGWPGAPAFALAFVAGELLFPLLFPWYLGASLHGVPLLLQVADLGGPYLPGLVVVAANLAIAELAQAVRARRAPSAAVLCAGAAAPLLALGYGAWRVRAVEAELVGATPMRVGVLQAGLAPGDGIESIAMHQLLTGELRRAGADLVVWSEVATRTAFSEGDPEAIRQAVTAELGVPTIVGTLIGRPPGRDAPARFFNSALLASADGTLVGRYDKQRLLAFGEYVPFGETFPALERLWPHAGRLSSGEELTTLPFGEHRIGALVCLEDILPAYVNRVMQSGAPELLVNLTNDVWFGDSAEPAIHLALSKLRAVEHHRYLVRATNNGMSAVIDPVGRVIAQTVSSGTETLLAEASLLRGRTGYQRWGDTPWYLLTLVVAGMAIIPWKRGKERARSYRN